MLLCPVTLGFEGFFPPLFAEVEQSDTGEVTSSFGLFGGWEVHQDGDVDSRLTATGKLPALCLFKVVLVPIPGDSSYAPSGSFIPCFAFARRLRENHVCTLPGSIPREMITIDF